MERKKMEKTKMEIKSKINNKILKICRMKVKFLMKKWMIQIKAF